MEQYSDFAYIYDELMAEDVCYADMAEYLLLLCRKRGVQPALALDLACGTGGLALELMQRNVDTIGIDLSPDMLAVAKEKAYKSGISDALFIRQDMRSFELFGTVDAIFCMTDSLNYITDKRDIKKIFSLAYNYLNPGGVLVFDINTIYKLQEFLGNNTFVYENEKVYYVWQNEYHTDTCTFMLDFFVRQKDESYQRFSEEHTERGYDQDFLLSALTKAGFSSINIYDGYSERKPTEKSLRITFCAVKS